jgi:hypothetical protein
MGCPDTHSSAPGQG